MRKIDVDALLLSKISRSTISWNIGEIDESYNRPRFGR